MITYHILPRKEMFNNPDALGFAVLAMDMNNNVTQEYGNRPETAFRTIKQCQNFIEQLRKGI